MKDGALLEPQIEVGDDVRVALFVLEDAMAVGVLAGVDGVGVGLESELVEGLDAVDDVLQFDAIGADVLDCGGAGFAGDVGEVFDAAPAAADGVADDVVPGFGGADAEDDLGVGLASDTATKRRLLPAPMWREWSSWKYSSRRMRPSSSSLSYSMNQRVRTGRWKVL